MLTPHGFLKGGMVTFDAQGTVLDVSSPPGIDSMPQVEFYSGILLPGMVNAHTHLELSYLKGSIGQGRGFAGFAAGLRDNRGRFSRKDIDSAIEYNDARMWADGVQAAGDICNGRNTFAAKKESRITYHSFIEMFGLDAGPAEAAHVASLRDEAVAAGLRATVTPHAMYSLNEEGFGLAVGWGDNSPLSIHFMESPGEAELFENKGEMRKWYDEAGFGTDFTASYASPAERVVSLVPAERKVLLVHNTMVGRQEIDILTDHFGNNATFVLCPRSNRFITGLTPPVALLRKNNVRIAIGTDSLASNHSLSLVEELKALGEVPLEEALGWVTIKGAEALGLDDVIGSFVKGKRPGAVLLTGVDWSDMSLSPEAETIRLV